MITITKEMHPQLIRAAATMAIDNVPYLSAGFFVASYRHDEKVPTMGIDPYMRIAYNDNFLMALVKEAEEVSSKKRCWCCNADAHHPLSYVSGVLLHEVMHPLREHHKRSQLLGAAFHPVLADLWNSAADFEINDDIYAICRSMSHYASPCLPDSAAIASRVTNMPMEDNNVAEYYFNELVDANKDALDMYDSTLEKLVQLAKEGKLKGYMRPMTGHGGEGAGVIFDPNLAPEPDDMTELEMDEVRDNVAKSVKAHAKSGRGNVPASMVVWANERIPNPEIDWSKQVAAAVTRALTYIKGSEEPTYTRLNRRSISISHAIGRPFVLPSRNKPVPKVGIVWDTSGSMHGVTDTAAAEVQGILKHTDSECVLVTCDADAQVTETADLRGARITGGGGTDMSVGIRAAVERGVDLCIVVTDCMTPWPEQSEMRGIPLIVCMCGTYIEESGVPDWAKAKIRVKRTDSDVR